MNVRKPVPFKPAALIFAGVVCGAMFSELLRPGLALAQPGKDLPPDKVLNAADRQQQMAASLSQINDRLGRIESLLTTGDKVKVTEMPATKDK